MASINSVQDQEATYISGVNAGGLAAEISFSTWNFDSPATYDGSEGRNYTAKFGPATAGSGATISYAFDAASNWTTDERGAFTATAGLWSAVANVTFVEAPRSSAQVILTRSSDEGASASATGFTAATTGTNQLGVSRRGTIDIDTSVAAFGPIGSTFSNYGGYPYHTLIHEWGHVLGLGHGGPYNEGEVDASVYTSFDNLAWTTMSYNDQSAEWGVSRGSDGLFYGRAPTTWMPLDIIAIQRLYGVAVNTPLSGGQTYGFHSNITGSIAKFFDFNQNAKPIVTLWNKGAGNTLDVSEFGQSSHIAMADGSFSSVAGLEDNIAIAYGTRIDTVITGVGDDTVLANNNSDNILGGAGRDSVIGGSGNDHIYGGGRTAVDGDGADTIDGGAGGDYLQGNAGNDQLDGGGGSDRIQGGQGDDHIVGGEGNDSANGNLGNDSVDGGMGNDSLRGGQGNDSLLGGADNDQLFGDRGADTLIGGSGMDALTGGDDADLFRFSANDARFLAGNPVTDIITDFADGVDKLQIFTTVGTVYHGAAYGDLESAAAAAEQILRAQAVYNGVDVLNVGTDSYLFYLTGSNSSIEAIKLVGIDASVITDVDFI